MKKILISFTIFLSCNILNASPVLGLASNTTPCFDINEVKPMGKQITDLLKQQFCDTHTDPKTFPAISQKILLQIMTEPFLGVPPPEGWHQVTDDIIKECFQNKDLCRNEARKDFMECFKPKMPLILIQFAPWLSENCSKLNHTLVREWPKKKEAIEKIIDESKK